MKFPFLTKIVEVHWRDANGRSGWADRREYEEHSPASIVSVGYLLKRTKDHVTIVMSLGEGEEINQAMSIPRDWVMKYRVIRK